MCGSSKQLNPSATGGILTANLASTPRKGEFIGLSNDDNYYVPGYLEQMVNELTWQEADLVVCQTLHSYGGWQVSAATLNETDLGAFIARRSLTEKVKWEGDDFRKADKRYIARLGEASRLSRSRH